MEQELKANLRMCAERYVGAKGTSLATIGRLAAGDWRFFDRVADDEKSFTARKYDEVIGWFSRNWPNEVEWPSEIKRPQATVEAAE